MDTSSKTAIQLLQALADSNERAAVLWEAIRTRPEVIEAVQRMEIGRYQSHPTIACYVDAELKSGKTICWWLEVYCGPERWEIESSILVNDEQGQMNLHDFPTRFAETFDVFLTEFRAAMSELASSVNVVDLNACSFAL